MLDELRIPPLRKGTPRGIADLTAPPCGWSAYPRRSHRPDAGHALRRGKLPRMPGGMPEGLYEALRTRGLDRLVARAALEAHFADVPAGDVSLLLGRHVGAAVERSVHDERDDERKKSLVNGAEIRAELASADRADLL